MFKVIEGVLNLQNLISMLKLSNLGFYVDIFEMASNWARLSIFIHADILVLVSEL